MIDSSSAVWGFSESSCIRQNLAGVVRSEENSVRESGTNFGTVLEEDSDIGIVNDFGNSSEDSTAAEGYQADSESIAPHTVPANWHNSGNLSPLNRNVLNSGIHSNLCYRSHRLRSNNSDSSDISSCQHSCRQFCSTSDSSDLLAYSSISSFDDILDEKGNVPTDSEVFYGGTPPPPPSILKELAFSNSLPLPLKSTGSPKRLVPHLRSYSHTGLFYGQDSDFSPEIKRGKKSRDRDSCAKGTLLNGCGLPINEDSGLSEQALRDKNPDCSRRTPNILLNGNSSEHSDQIRKDVDVFKGKIQSILEATSGTGVRLNGKGYEKCSGNVYEMNSNDKGHNSFGDLVESISSKHQYSLPSEVHEMSMAPSDPRSNRMASLPNGKVMPCDYRLDKKNKTFKYSKCSPGKRDKQGRIHIEQVMYTPQLEWQMQSTPTASSPHSHKQCLVPSELSTNEAQMQPYPTSSSSHSHKETLFPSELSRKEAQLPRFNGSHRKSFTVEAKMFCDDVEKRRHSTPVTLPSSAVKETDLSETKCTPPPKEKWYKWTKGRSSKSKACCDNVQEKNFVDNDVYPFAYWRRSEARRKSKSNLENRTKEFLGSRLSKPNRSKSCVVPGDMNVHGNDEQSLPNELQTRQYEVEMKYSDNVLDSVKLEKRERLKEGASGKKKYRSSHSQEAQKDVTGDAEKVPKRKRRSGKASESTSKTATECHLRAFSEAVLEDVDTDAVSAIEKGNLPDNWILRPRRSSLSGNVNGHEAIEMESVDFNKKSTCKCLANGSENSELESSTSSRKRSLTRSKSEGSSLTNDEKAGLQKEKRQSRLEKLGLHRYNTDLTSFDMIEVEKVKKKIQELRKTKERSEMSSVSRLAEFFWAKRNRDKNDNGSERFCHDETHEICYYLQKYRNENANNRKSDKESGAQVGSRRTSSTDRDLKSATDWRGYPLCELPVDLNRQRRRHHRCRHCTKHRHRRSSEIKEFVFGDLTASQTDVVLEKLRRRSPWLLPKENEFGELPMDKLVEAHLRLTPQPKRRYRSRERNSVPGDSKRKAHEKEGKTENGPKNEKPAIPTLGKKSFHRSCEDILETDSMKHREKSSVRRKHAMRRSRQSPELTTSPKDDMIDNHGLVYIAPSPINWRRQRSFDRLDKKVASNLWKTYSVPNISLKPKLEVGFKAICPAEKSYESANGSSSRDPSPKRGFGLFTSFSRADKKDRPTKKPVQRSQTAYRAGWERPRPNTRSYSFSSGQSKSRLNSESSTASAESWASAIEELESHPIVGRKVSFFRKLATEQIEDISLSVENMQNTIKFAVEKIQACFDDQKAIEIERRQSSGSDTNPWRRSSGEVLPKEDGKSEELVTRLLEDAMESDVHTKVDGLEDSNRSNFEYDKYGFSKTPLLDEEENHLVARAKRLQKDSEDIINSLEGSDHETSLRVKWENYFVNLGNRDLQPCLDLKILIRQGIPYDFKEKVWKAVINFRVGKMRQKLGPDYYNNLLSSHAGIQRYNPAAKQIELDLLRTLPNNKHYESLSGEGIPRLRRILQAYSSHNPLVGYCQGLNRLVAIALLFLNEEDAFWCLVCIVDFIMPQDYYSKTLIASQADQRVLKDLINEKIPRLHAHLEQYGVDMSLFTFNWFLTVFVDNIPVETFLRIWDAFLYEGTKVLFRFAIAFFKYAEEDILALKDHIAIHKYLRVVGEMMMDCKRLCQIAFHDLNPFPMKSINTKRAYHLLQVKHELEELDAIREDFKSREIPADRQEFWSDDDLD